MASPLYRGDRSVLHEASNSPEYVFGEVVTMTRTYNGSAALCLSSAPMRGAAGTGVASGYKVEESKVTQERGGMAKLVIKYVTDGEPPQGGQLPADEVGLDRDKVERALQEHPNYSGLSEELNTAIKTLLETAEDHSSHADAKALVEADATANELYLKLRKGFTHYVIYPPVYHETEYSWDPPTGLSVGGVRETPPAGALTLPTGVDWLREGDKVSFNGTHWQVQRSWLGAPDLDADIYP